MASFKHFYRLTTVLDMLFDTDLYSLVIYLLNAWSYEEKINTSTLNILDC